MIASIGEAEANQCQKVTSYHKNPPSFSLFLETVILHDAEARTGKIVAMLYFLVSLLILI